MTDFVLGQHNRAYFVLGSTQTFKTNIPERGGQAMLERTIREITGEQKLLRVHGEDSGVNAALVMADRRIPLPACDRTQ